MLKSKHYFVLYLDNCAKMNGSCLYLNRCRPLCVLFVLESASHKPLCMSLHYSFRLYYANKNLFLERVSKKIINITQDNNLHSHLRVF